MVPTGAHTRRVFSPDRRDPRAVDVRLERDAFFRTLLRHLTGALEDIVGVRDASGFVSIVGQRMGDELGAEYRRALAVERLPSEQLGAVLVDLKRRIGGDFRVVEQTEDRIVFVNRACPFGDKVVGRPSLCMMTSNVFGAIASDSAGYAKVAIEKAIARGDAGCRVIVYLRPSEQAAAAEGREYVRE
jgi:predicted ArsR family transcriptional regulator